MIVTNEITSKPELEIVTLSDVLGERAFDTVRIGEEALLLHYIDSTLRTYGKRLDLLSFEYKDEVLKCPYFSLVALEHRELITLVEERGWFLESANVYQNKFFKGSLDSIEIKVSSDDENHWVFSENGSTDDVNKVVYGGHASFSYVALLAYMLVVAYIDGVKLSKITIDNRVGYIQTESFSLVPNLIYWGNRVFLRFLTVYLPTATGDIAASDAEFRSKSWSAYFEMLRTLGYKRNYISTIDKYNFLKESYHVGMPVFLYVLAVSKRSKDSKEDLNSTSRAKKEDKDVKATIGHAQLAIIRGITKQSIQLEILRNVNTKIGRILSREESIANSEQGDLYTIDYSHLLKLHTSVENFDLTTMGVEHLLFKEEFFILPVSNTEDAVINLRTSENGGQLSVPVNTLDFVYTMLEEWEIEYDKLRYLATHFPNGKRPVYENYRDFNTIAKIMKT